MEPLVLLEPREPRELQERSARLGPLDPQVEQGLQDRTALWAPRVQLDQTVRWALRAPRGQLGEQVGEGDGQPALADHLRRGVIESTDTKLMNRIAFTSAVSIERCNICGFSITMYTCAIPPY